MRDRSLNLVDRRTRSIADFCWPPRRLVAPPKPARPGRPCPGQPSERLSPRMVPPRPTRFQPTGRSEPVELAAPGRPPLPAAASPPNLGQASLGESPSLQSGQATTPSLGPAGDGDRLHRQGWPLNWRWRSGTRLGPPRRTPEVRELITTMADQNPMWGKRTDPRRAIQGRIGRHRTLHPPLSASAAAPDHRA